MLILLQMCSIKKLVPRLKSTLFKLQFSELVSDIKPVSILFDMYSSFVKIDFSA